MAEVEASPTEQPVDDTLGLDTSTDPLDVPADETEGETLYFLVNY